METSVDFLNWLEHDTSLKIFSYLDEPSDLVRISSISRSWHHFVIANDLCKQLCFRMFPRLSSAACTELISDVNMPADMGCSSSVEWESKKKEHRVYACLAHGLKSFPIRTCLSEAISASSTDNHPEESIRNTLEPRDAVEIEGRVRASYWSSEGQKDTSVPETLLYKLVSNLCLVTEIYMRPFKAYFQMGFPIYSAKSVRFRFGHPKPPLGLEVALMGAQLEKPIDDNFVWTYTSPVFPMAQEYRLQKFELPEPVLCIGGIMQIELLGRVQKQQMDGLYYICIAHVQVVGRPLLPSFDARILEPSGKFLLKYYPQAKNDSLPGPLEAEYAAVSGAATQRPEFAERQINGWEQIVGMLLGHAPDYEVMEWEDEFDESDEEFI